MKPTILLACAGLILAAAAAAFAHPGGLDANGGHFDRRTGLYHYHRGTGAASAPTPQQPMVLTPREETPPPNVLAQLQQRLDAQAAEIAALTARVAALEAKGAPVESPPAIVPGAETKPH